MLARLRRVIRDVGNASRVIGAVGVRTSDRGARGRGKGGRADSEVRQAHIHVQSDGLRRNDRAVLGIAIAALAVRYTLAVRGHVAVAAAVGDGKPRWWCHGLRWRCGRRGRRGRRGWQRWRCWWLRRSWRRRRRRLGATDNTHICDGRVLIAPPAPGIFEAKVFSVEEKARGTPRAVVCVAVHAPDCGTLRVDQLERRAVCTTQGTHGARALAPSKQARVHTHAQRPWEHAWLDASVRGHQSRVVAGCSDASLRGHQSRAVAGW